MARPSAPPGAQRTASELEFFDRFVHERGDYDVLSEEAYQRLLQLFERKVRPRPGERCIDLGCGTGAFTRRLSHFDLRVEGMDISPAAVALANSLSKEERFSCGDITDTKLPDQSYDLVLYSGVLHHFDSPRERIRVLSEGHRLLVPGGRLFAYDPNRHSPSMWLYRDPRSPLSSRAGVTENEVLLSRGELSAELAAAGFRGIEVLGASGMTFKFVESHAARVLLPLYNLYERAVRFSPFERRLGTFLVSVAFKS